MFLKKSKALLMPFLILSLFGLLIGCSNPAKTASAAVSKPASSQASSSSAAQVSSAAKNSSSSCVSSAPKSSSSKPVSKESSKVSEKEVSKPQFSKSITLTIDASKGGDGVVANAINVGINAGDSVYAALKRYCDANKIIVAGSSNYVSAIDGISEFDHGSGSGWLYCVNGTFPQEGCGSYKLSGGENVKFVYTLDYGKTEEGK